MVRHFPNGPSMISRPRRLAAALLLILALALAAGSAGGCGFAGASAPDRETSVQTTGALRQIAFWTFVPQFEQDMVFRFNSGRSDSEIKLIYVAADEILPKFHTTWAANNGLPDIITFPNSAIREMRQLDRLENLSAEPYLFDRTKLADSLQTLYPGDSAAISIPQSPSPYGMIYRRDLTNRYLGTGQAG